MSKDFNWDGFNKKMDGVQGFSSNPYYGRRGALPSKAQMEFIEKLVDQLENAGVSARYIIEDEMYKKHAGIAVSAIRALLKLRAKNGMAVGAKAVYVNLCEEKKSGKRIKYRTHKRYAAPVGYKFIGQISCEVVYPEAV